MAAWMLISTLDELINERNDRALKAGEPFQSDIS